MALARLAKVVKIGAMIGVGSVVVEAVGACITVSVDGAWIGARVL